MERQTCGYSSFCLSERESSHLRSPSHSCWEWSPQEWAASGWVGCYQSPSALLITGPSPLLSSHRATSLVVEQSVIVIVVGPVNEECDDTVQTCLCFYPAEVNLMRSAIESGGGGGERWTGAKEKHTMKYNLCVTVCVYQIYQNISFCVFKL